MKTDDQHWEDWIRETLRGRSLHEPGKAALRQALALGSQLTPAPGATGWLVRLIFDSAGQPLPVGARSAAAGERRLLFDARPSADPEAALQLDLRIRRDPGGDVELTGQLLPPWPGARVEARALKNRRTTTLGDSGEFLIRRLPRGAVRLELQLRRADGESLEFLDIPLLADDDGAS